MKIIAIRDMAEGNESVGEMWQETKIFEPHEPIENVIKWAVTGVMSGKLRKRLTLTVAQNEEDKL